MIKKNKEIIACFIDEIYYKKGQKYVSKYVSGNFLKILYKETNWDIAFILPVKKNQHIVSYSTELQGDRVIIELLPGWDSVVSYYKFLANPFNYLKLRSRIKKLVRKYNFFWIRLPSPFGLWLGKEVEKANKLALYHVAGDIRLAYLSQKYKRFKFFAKIMGKYFHYRSLKLGKNGVFLTTGSVLFNDYKKANKRVIPFIDSLVREHELIEPNKEISVPIKFLYVGNFSENKGVFFLISAVEKLRKKYCTELNIVGFGEDEEKIYKISKEKKFIKLHGFIPHGERLTEIYRECDIFVLPSLYYEGFPRVILEAWANGLFVIASEVGGIKGIGKDGVNLLFFKPGDECDFIRKVEVLLEEPNVRERLRQGIRDIQREITAEHMIKKIKEIIKRRK